jgi:hypothetical protein
MIVIVIEVIKMQYPIKINDTEIEVTYFGIEITEHIQYDEHHYYNFKDIIEV